MLCNLIVLVTKRYTYLLKNILTYFNVLVNYIVLYINFTMYSAVQFDCAFH